MVLEFLFPKRQLVGETGTEVAFSCHIGPNFVCPADVQVVAISFEPANNFFRARKAAVKAATFELDEKERREYLDIGPRQSGNVAEALNWFGISLSDSI